MWSLTFFSSANAVAELYSDRFSNKTNGVTPRHRLLQASSGLSAADTDAISDR